MIEHQILKRAVDKNSALQVYCLGIFRVIRPRENEPIGTISKHKMWVLFKYLISHKGGVVPTTQVMDLLWPDNSNPEDTATLRTTISRLKSFLEPKRVTYRKSSYIIYCKDSCAFNIHAPYWLDTEEFESLCKLAHRLGDSNRKIAIDFYLQALDLYQGDFLAEDPDLEWTFIPREHYRRLFVESILEVATWLLELQDYSKAVSLLKKGVQIDPYNEAMQIMLMKSLLGSGDIKAAAEHYAYCSGLYYKELGVKPSVEWKQLYKQIRRTEDDLPYQQIINGNLESSINDQGPFICDSDFFWNFLLFERRRLARNGGESSLVVLQLTPDPKGKTDGTMEKEAFEQLQRIVIQNLRRCDVVCKLDDQHLALLLPFTGVKGSKVAVNQINESFCKINKQIVSLLQIKVKRVIPL